ncbi:hypothetical protein BKA67DRAFT_4265 [Truncatella angustata]|uniref:Uncharacterized protein n=1 Tax=Truncatella angustata TaxID=152316 RepID=A0A9P8UVX2_9PEZI|nr:uncharacterized protein BKA67DRAFT_4265 [Truncatella angustata]KAH6659031.1 hypothetical protein BKA67DRAFT_4265 [Truncatella angustata]
MFRRRTSVLWLALEKLRICRLSTTHLRRKVYPCYSFEALGGLNRTSFDLTFIKTGCVIAHEHVAHGVPCSTCAAHACRNGVPFSIIGNFAVPFPSEMKTTEF